MEKKRKKDDVHIQTFLLQAPRNIRYDIFNTHLNLQSRGGINRVPETKQQQNQK